MIQRTRRINMVVKKKRRLEHHVKDKETMEEKNIRPFVSDEVILYEILPWVPVKSLFRFKLVCKEWCEVISRDRVFNISQYKRCETRPPTLLWFDNESNQCVFIPSNGQSMVSIPDLTLKSLHFPLGAYSIDLLASSNGLFCGSYYREEEKYFYVSNPITKELVSIPNLNGISNVVLAFDPLSSGPFFMLVGLYLTEGLFCTDVTFPVYSSKIGTWCVANAKTQIFHSIWGGVENRSVVTGGIVYWKLEKSVLWFHIKEDSAGVVVLPYKEERYTKGEIGNCNGEVTYTMTSETKIEIWVLRSSEKIGFKWERKCGFRLRGILGDDSKVIFSSCNKMMVLLRHDLISRSQALPYEGGDVLLLWVLHILGRVSWMILAYNMKSGSLQLVHKVERGRWGINLISYKSSLVSVPRPGTE